MPKRIMMIGPDATDSIVMRCEAFKQTALAKLALMPDRDRRFSFCGDGSA